MKKTLLATAAAIAVMTTSASWAQRQDAPASGAEQPQRAPAAQQNAPAEKMAPSGQVAPSRANEGAASGNDRNDRAQGTQVPPGQSRSTTGQSGAGGQMDRDRSGPSGAQRQEGREGGADQQRPQQRGERGDGDRQTPRAQQDRPGQGNTAQDRERGRQDGNNAGNTAQDRDRQGGSSTTAQGARGGAGSSVSLTAEQKTKIRSTVLTSNAPRVTNVNFSINVGTVVPRTVRVVAVPPTLVEIHPEWSGFMYFVHGDEIIVVEPGSLRIVAVLSV